MAAITAAEQGVRQVLVLEGTPEPLQKVRISGGGLDITRAVKSTTRMWWNW